MRQARNINNLGRASSRYPEMCDACTPAGYINLGDGKHYYFAKDYQGSTRAVYTHYEGSMIGPGNPDIDQHTIPVQVENLITRVMGGNIYYDGLKHSPLPHIELPYEKANAIPTKLY